MVPTAVCQLPGTALVLAGGNGAVPVPPATSPLLSRQGLLLYWGGGSHPSPPPQASHVTAMQKEDSERGRNMVRKAGSPQTSPLLEEGLPWPEPQELAVSVGGFSWR